MLVWSRVVRFSRFDVSEEILVLSESPVLIHSRLALLVAENPDAVMLCGRDALRSSAPLLDLIDKVEFPNPFVAN